MPKALSGLSVGHVRVRLEPLAFRDPGAYMRSQDRIVDLQQVVMIPREDNGLCTFVVNKLTIHRFKDLGAPELMALLLENPHGPTSHPRPGKQLWRPSPVRGANMASF